MNSYQPPEISKTTLQALFLIKRQAFWDGVMIGFAVGMLVMVVTFQLMEG